MKTAYFETIMLIEKLHRLHLEVVKYELDKMKIEDISNVQAMILYNIGQGQVTIGELTNRGYYLGSNVSYNLKKMISFGYITQEPSPHDRRSSRVRLSPKDIELHKKLDHCMTRQVEALKASGMQADPFAQSVKDLNELAVFFERFPFSEHM